ncbi:FAD-binding monooxygenase [Pseudonocardia sulfidoxydans NBRC 16205]|uniref:FAD-binding monooxygenase n=1 Tax=Pseudonocardia sulfidoxydans NBRC 16205 TaxID=1223511 RepID=A0A511DJE4_9PSEU|nr:FAD-binding monooxygenase [Pseudonocardia sulfidoxydans]GEL24929.1 FAD-binding monooxygenase [Pseudonocardia sulfidoxydans NBRC 16205]
MPAHAVVLGAGMAGLLAARVLSETFDRVTVLDRDTLPDGAEPRRGVPQGPFPHALLPRGRQILDDLFPDLVDGLLRDGATEGSVERFRFLLAGTRFARFSEGGSLLAGRPLLEAHVRAAVGALPGVTILDRRTVLGLVADRGRITGVQVDPGGTVAADLVVDASGRTSRTDVWLEDLGFPVSPGESVRVEVAYTCGRFRLRDDALDGDHVVLVSGVPGNSRSGAVFPVEGGEHLVSLSGTFGEHAPTELDGFHRYAATLPFPDIADALGGAELREPLRTMRFVENRRRRPDTVDGPRGLLLVGDALCSVNPVYGQGMTMAALQAEELRRILARNPDPHPRGTHRRLMRATAAGWDNAVGADSVDPRVEVHHGRADRLIGRWVARVQRAAGTDPVVARAFIQVTGLVDPPQTLLRPGFVVRVLRATRRDGAPRVTAPPMVSTGSGT